MKFCRGDKVINTLLNYRLQCLFFFSPGHQKDCPPKYLGLCLGKPTSQVDVEVQLCSVEVVLSTFLCTVSL